MLFSNDRGEMTLTSMVAACLVVALLAGGIALWISDSSSVYDTTGFDSDSLGNYNYGDSLASDINTAYGEVDVLNVDANAFDYFAGIWNKLTSPFKTIYRSFDVVTSLTSQATDDLGLDPIVKNFLVAAFTAVILLIILGIYIARKT